MHRLKLSNILILIVLIVITILALLAVAAVQAQSSPPDFRLILSAPGVGLYQKDYPGGYPDFVQTTNLRQGASIALMHGAMQDRGSGRGAYGGDSPSFRVQPLAQVWQTFSADNPTAFCLSNGGFFSTNEDPTQLAFPLKVDGEVISEGYGRTEYPSDKLMLEIWDAYADIVPLSEEALYSSSAPDIIAGLSVDADKGIMEPEGRAFIGLADADGDGSYEVLLVFNSKSSTQPAAADILRSFGAEKVMMLDGGRSAQLICQGETYVPSNREIPQTIGMLSGEAETPPQPGISPGESLGELTGSLGKAVQGQVDELWQAARDKAQDMLKEEADEKKQQLTDWVKEQIQAQGQQLQQWAEDEINQVFNQICGSAFLPGVVALAWWARRKSNRR